MDRRAMRISQTALVLMLSSLIAGGCCAPRPGPAHELSRCRARVLALRAGTRISPMTGEMGDLYEVVNRGPVSCVLKGYPSVVLYSASGTRLPFRYARGGRPYVTPRQPETVVLAPGASAHIMVAKSRCDLRILHNARSIRITVPARGAQFVGHDPVPVSDGRALPYCQGGKHHPDQLITVSPLEPTAGKTTPFV